MSMKENKAIKGSIPSISMEEIPEDVLGFWEASEEEQKEIDDIINDLNIDFE